MKHLFIIIGLIGFALLASLFPTWNFDESIAFPADENPLWKSGPKEIKSPLTEELNLAGFSFYTNRGAEAEPDGVCFGDFGSDEYWVVQYKAERYEVSVHAWISEINWLGHLLSSRRFSDLERILQRNLKI